MKLSGHRRMSLTKGGSMDSSKSAGASDDETVVEPDQGNVLSHIISQLRPGADLSRVTLPTFILEPRSMLERITNFMAHPELLLPIPALDDPVQRFVSVVKFYLSGWHIRPAGVKKPLNPLLGETFTGWWDYADGTRGYYIAEQTSHHPPKSSYFFLVPAHSIRIDGTLKPRSKFLGNSAASMMEGIAVLRFTRHGERGTGPGGGERYFVTQPNMYARGILFGKMKYELGDHSYVRCPENHLAADIEFKVKGYFSGTYNAIGGVIRNEQTGEVLYELSGSWNGEMWLRNVVDGQRELLWDARGAKHSPPQVRPLAEQGDRESQKLWRKTNEAIVNVDHTAATDEKTAIEEMQRQEAAQRQQDGLVWHPRLFRPVQGGPGGPEEGEEALDWIIDADVSGKTPEELTEQVFAIAPVMPGQKAPAYTNAPTPGRDLGNGVKSTPKQAPPAAGSAPAGGDLIDLSDDPSSPSHPPSRPAASTNASLLSQLQPSTGYETPASSHPPSGGPSQSEPVKRQDTNSQEDEVFVDAEE